MTLLELITMSLKDIGAYNIGDSLDTDESNDAVAILNNLQDEWNADGLIVNAVTREYFSLVIGQASYTWGTAGSPNFNSARPVRIIKSFIRDGNNDYPVDMISMDEYEDLPDKINQGRPDRVWQNPTYPLTTLYFYFVPDSTYQWWVDSEKDLIDFTSLGATISMPPEYMAAFRWNLARDLCPSYRKQPPPLVVKRADDTIKTLRRINLSNKMGKIRPSIFTVKQSTDQGTILSYD